MSRTQLSLAIHPSDLMMANQMFHFSTSHLVQAYGNLVRHYPSLLLAKEAIQSTQTGLFQAYNDLLLQYPNFLGVQQEISAHTKNWLQAYGHLLSTYPITTKSITASILACTGDAIAQWRSTSDKYDVRRGLAFLVFGALYTGAFQHVWFTYLGQHISDWGASLGIWGPERIAFPVEYLVNDDEWWRYFDIVSSLEHPPSPMALAAAKLLLNQFLVIPFFYMPLFLAMTGALAGLDFKSSLARAQSLYFPLLKRNWFFWLPTQFLQFLVIPGDFQIPFLSTASLVWTVILSTIGSGAARTSSAQTIVAYYDEQQGDAEERRVTVRQVNPDPADEVTDNVRLEDVVPDALVNVTSDARTRYATGGVVAGLLAAAFDEGALGSMVGRLVGAQAPGVGVAITMGIGAVMGLTAAIQQGTAAETKMNPHEAGDKNNNNKVDDQPQEQLDLPETKMALLHQLQQHLAELRDSGHAGTSAKHHDNKDEGQSSSLTSMKSSAKHTHHC